MDTLRASRGPGLPLHSPALKATPALFGAAACVHPRALAQRNHRETKHGPRGRQAGVGTWRPVERSQLPVAGKGSQGAAGRPGASVRTFLEVFQNLPPTLPRSIFPSRRGCRTRARTDGWSWGGGPGGGRPGRAGVLQPHAPWAAPASPAAIVPAPPPPAASPPPTRAPAPTPGRGSRLRRRRRRWRRHNNINTAGPPAAPALRRPPHSPGNAANGDRKARRRDWRRPGARHGRYPGLLAALRSQPRRPASAAPLSNRDAGRHRARPPTSSRRAPPPRLAYGPRGGAASGPGLRGQGSKSGAGLH